MEWRRDEPIGPSGLEERGALYSLPCPNGHGYYLPARWAEAYPFFLYRGGLGVAIQQTFGWQARSGDMEKLPNAPSET